MKAKTKMNKNHQIRLPRVEQSNNKKRYEEVDDGGCEHHVQAPGCFLVEGNTAPGRLLQYLVTVAKIVHLSEVGPRRCREETH